MTECTIKCDCPRTTHHHGDYLMYNIHGCRGDDCREAATSYAAAYRHLMKIGRHNNGFTDAAPVRDRLRQLIGAGYTVAQIASMTGAHYNTVYAIYHGQPWKGKAPRTRCRVGLADKIMGFQPTPDMLPEGTRIDATGTRRRLQALAAIGWSVASMADYLGVDRGNFILVIRQDKVTAGRAQQVKEMYEELWDRVPDQSTPSKRAGVTNTRRWAASHKWPPPMWWDDDQIDDPTYRVNFTPYQEKVTA